MGINGVDLGEEGNFGKNKMGRGREREQILIVGVWGVMRCGGFTSFLKDKSLYLIIETEI